MGNLSEILGCCPHHKHRATGRGNSSTAGLEGREKWESHPSANISASLSFSNPNLLRNAQSTPGPLQAA